MSTHPVVLPCTPGQEWGCAVLASVASLLASHPGKGSGALQAVSAAMAAHPLEGPVQERGCDVLAQLGSHPELVEAQGPGVWELPLKAMQAHPYSARVQVSACKAIQALVLSNGELLSARVVVVDACVLTGDLKPVVLPDVNESLLWSQSVGLLPPLP